ncbi:MAG: aminotransferase class V-fold PLP-dependent enzyme [Pseudomonadota bacterium]
MTPFAVPSSRAEAEARDRTDPLRSARSAFALPPDKIYLVGHSLGPATHAALDRTQHAASSAWAEGLVGSWNTAGWIDIPSRLGERIAPLLGAAAHDVVVCDSVSVNLFKLAAAVLPLARSAVFMVEQDEFPTDQYIAGGLAHLAGQPLRRLSREASLHALKEGGILIKSLVSYRDGLVADMAAYEDVAKEAGGFVIWDLSHAVGIVPVDLKAAGAQLAVGCTYKYLNGGPGSPSFLFVRDEIVETLTTPLPGWLGHREPFAFSPHYEPADGALRFVAGTPSILSCAALDGALDAFQGVSVLELHRKAGQLGDLCIARAQSIGLDVRSPVDAARRGGHVSLGHEAGYPLVRALAERGIQADFRTPDTIRLGFSPLFLRYVDVWDAMEALDVIVRERLWDEPRFHLRAKVT